MSRFRPSRTGTLLAVALILSCSGLAKWQWNRANDKDLAIATRAQAGMRSALPPTTEAREGMVLMLTGQFDPQRHVLVDNRVNEGKAGVHVLTPFRTPDGLVLVNRGWLPMPADRSVMPVIPTRPGVVEISGRLAPISGPGLRLGHPDSMQHYQWPQLVTYPEPAAIAEALGETVLPLILLLHPESPDGFEGRDWKTFHMTPEKHRGYAFQWMSLAVAALLGWLIIGMGRARRPGGA